MLKHTNNTSPSTACRLSFNSFACSLVCMFCERKKKFTHSLSLSILLFHFMLFFVDSCVLVNGNEWQKNGRPNHNRTGFIGMKAKTRIKSSWTCEKQQDSRIFAFAIRFIVVFASAGRAYSRAILQWLVFDLGGKKRSEFVHSRERIRHAWIMLNCLRIECIANSAWIDAFSVFAAWEMVHFSARWTFSTDIFLFNSMVFGIVNEKYNNQHFWYAEWML